MRTGLGAAAAVMAVFVIMLNTNTAFAESVSEIPIIGTIARVVTFSYYEKSEENLKISIEIPSVEMIAKDTNGVADKVNQEIYASCERYAAEAVKRMEEYRTAFLETGGTQEEWEARGIEIKVGYEVKAQTENYLSFAIIGTENWISSNAQIRYYNIDLRNEKAVTLEDILGEDYMRIVNESISAQMEEKAQEEEIEFFSPEEGGFTGISEDARFYMNTEENPVIVFEKYEIAAGVYGEIEFEIEK